jgi:hypothetical protein
MKYRRIGIDKRAIIPTIPAPGKSLLIINNKDPIRATERIEITDMIIQPKNDIFLIPMCG